MVNKTKKCKTCGKDLNLASFYLRKAAPDRYQNDCKECYKLKRNERRYEPSLVFVRQIEKEVARVEARERLRGERIERKRKAFQDRGKTETEKAKEKAAHKVREEKEINDLL